MVLTGGFPRLVLLAEFTGYSEREADTKARAAQRDLSIFGVPTRVTKTELEAQKYWTIRRESFNLLRKQIKNLHTAPFIDDMVVRPEYLPDFLPRLEALLKPYDLLYSIAGHAGDGNFHIIPLMKLSDPRTRQVIPELSRKVYELVLEFHGSITGEHNDGLIRSPFLKQMYGDEVYRLFERIKSIFDPDNIFNPGKKVGADPKWAMEHIRKD
jgi:FAD/FMN-containing dehydrogenase